MGSRERVLQEVARLNEDYASQGDGPFTHFFFPILLKDEDVELCMGHVISARIKNCCRATVVQRRDVDAFYGSICEAAFKTIVDVHSARSAGRQVISDPGLRRALPMTVRLGDQKIDCYEARNHVHPSHPIVELHDDNGAVFKLAIKVTDTDIPENCRMQLTIFKDFMPETVATLLKMAHLTQFAVLGYQYVFGAAGLMLADILRTFFLENKDRSREQKMSALDSYFRKHAGMVMPAVGYDQNVIRGSIEDRRFLVCIGSSGRWYAFGVFIRVNEQMHVVLVPSDRADSVGTYFDLISSMHERAFKFQLVEFVPASDNEQAHWKVGRKEYTFQPESVANITE
jgi:hypothetical protein